MTAPRYFPTFALILTPLLLLSGCNNSEQPNANLVEVARPAKIVPVVSSAINLERTYPATLEASQRADLAFRVGGQLDVLPATAGIEVKKGDLLARLDDRDYKNTVNQRKARYDLAKIQHEQSSKLLKRRLSSQLQYDQTAAELKAARSALEAAKDNLKYTRLLAPFDGVIARVEVENHQAIQAKMPIIELQNAHTMDIRFSIPESVVSQLRTDGENFEADKICGFVTFNANPSQHYKACHKEHESIADPLTRNYPTLFTLAETPDFTVLPGMSASMKLDLSPYMLKSQTGAGLFLPIEAVFERDGKSRVWVVNEDMRARETEVVIGRIEEGLLQISSGVDVGQPVIAAGVSYIQEGMLVKPMKKERGL